MSDMSNQDVGVAVARVEGTVSRVEVKLDVALGDVLRRMDVGEEDRRKLHGRVTTQGIELSAVKADVEILKARVGGAFTKYVTPTLAALALISSTILAIIRL